MKHDIIVARTQYSDRLGTVAGEHHQGPEERTFEEIFRKAGLDFEKYRPIAFSFSIDENQLHVQEPSCTLIAHCVLKEEAENIPESTVLSGSSLPIHKAYVSITPTEFTRLFKRLRVTFVVQSKGDSTYGSNSYIEDIQDEFFL